MPQLNFDNTTWDLRWLVDASEEKLDELFAQEQSVLQSACQSFVDRWSNRSDYLTDPKILRQALDDYESWRKNYGTSGRQGFYIALSLALDQNNPWLRAKESQINELSVHLENQVQFFTHRLSRLDSQTQTKFLQSPELSPYTHFLERLFAIGRYLLSEEEEKILNLKHYPAHTKWVQMLDGFLNQETRSLVVAGETKNYSFSEILNLTSHKQKPIRDAAVNAFNEILQKYSHIAENELNAVLYNKIIDDTLRNFPRPDSTRHLSDDVDSQMVDELIQTVSQRYNISQKFYELKAKLFKVPKLAYHERNVEYGEIDLNFPWPEAAGLVYDTLWSLDPLFAQIFNRFLEESRVDVFPKAGKDSGAFCAPTRSNLPVYVLLNHTDRLNDVRTLAHEMGHAINFELMKQENELNYDSSLFIAESCSTFIEDFVLEKIIQTSDEETKLTILMEKLNNDVSTIFRQVAFYRFELDLHQSFRTKGYLSYQEIGQLFQKHMSEYMGEFVSQDPGSENWWIYVGHFRNFFYVYSYAAGLLVSKFLQNQVRQNHAFMEQIKTYYATGTSQSPKNILAKIGVNVNSQLWNQGLDQVEELLNQTWWLAKKLQKIDT